ncbi:endonuclease III-like protein 1 [Oscarella lobularis]|uniref:endonuclease III-like protein 1 n=1 Tax=Oscarella lobularis TaxID=121494 RepID=UPI003313AABE
MPRKRRRVRVEYEDIDAETAEKKIKAALLKKETSARSSAESLPWEPVNWRLQFENIKAMRSERSAPVDQMGAECQASSTLPPNVSRFHVLVSLMLSSQTKDQVTDAAVKRLKDYGLTIENILSITEEKIGKLIYPVGFWKRKANYLKRTCQILKDDFDCDIPRSVEGLCSLPGVGPKMAHLAMNIAWNECTGIGVDTHVHRIANRLRWVRKPTKTPEQTRKSLEEWLPRELWKNVNLILVGFGQQICVPVSPRCHGCSNSSMCPSSSTKNK